VSLRTIEPAPLRTSVSTARDTSTRVPGTEASPASGGLLLIFGAIHIASQLLLLVPAFGAVRVVVRMGAFGMGLAFILFVRRKDIRQKAELKLPLKACALSIVGILGLELFHPEGGGLLPGIAEIMLTLAVMAPIFWLPRITVGAHTFQRLVTMLWVFYSASATTGVLQAMFPGRFQPGLSTIVTGLRHDAVNSLQIKLASGERIFRPMGLTDIPGGAAYGGLFAVILGIGMLLQPKPPFFGGRLLAFGSMIVGAMCLYLCQVRSVLVMTGICVITLVTLLMISGRVTRLMGLAAALGAVIQGAFVLAVSLGGRAVTDRLNTLVQADAGTVYYKNRGHFLETTINTHLPQYPLGAGLGRWGMVNYYFGEMTGYLYVEIQWTGWLFDGGVPLILLYVAALLITTWGCVRVALGRAGASAESLSIWGAVLVAYNVGTLALTFNYVVFTGTAGVEFWLLNVALLCAAQNSKLAPRPTVAA